jgi:hypothetical protein
MELRFHWKTGTQTDSIFSSSILKIQMRDDLETEGEEANTRGKLKG